LLELLFEVFSLTTFEGFEVLFEFLVLIENSLFFYLNATVKILFLKLPAFSRDAISELNEFPNFISFLLF